MSKLTSLISPRASCLAILLFGLAAQADDQSDSKKKETQPESNIEAYDSKTRGAIQVTGDTGDWFTIYQGENRVSSGVPKKVGGVEELPPGKYEVYVNKTKRAVTLEAGKKIILRTGTLTVEGKGALWFTPYLGKERMLVSNPPVLNSAIALFPGTYTVWVHVQQHEEKLGDAKVLPGQKTVLRK